MDGVVPPIYARCEPPARATIMERAIALGIAAGCLAVLLVAASLHPDPSGMGSHRALGLPSCQFLGRTGLPCPSCGMTTSFTWFVRGNFVASLYVQPMGAVLAALCCIAVWMGFYIAATGRPVHRLLRLLPGQWMLVVLLSIALSAWAWKIIIHLAGHDGWG